MNRSPLLTIVIPLYNVELYVADAIRSILNQEFDDYEIIVINDGSQDRSVDVVKNIMQTEERIRLYHQENRGLASTRNRGLDLSSGVFIYFLDADDMLKPGALGRIMDRIQSSGSELVYFPGQFADKDGKSIPEKPDFFCYEQLSPVQGEEVLLQLVKKGCYSPNVQKYLYRKEYLLQNKLRFEDGFSHEDEAFTIRALCLAMKMVAFKETLMYKRLRPDSIMSSTKALHNVRGWLQAATTITFFAEAHYLQDETRNFIHYKARSMILTAKKIVRKLNRQENSRISIHDHLQNDIPAKLGLCFKLQLKFDRLLGVLNMISSR